MFKNFKIKIHGIFKGYKLFKYFFIKELKFSKIWLQNVKSRFIKNYIN